MPRAPVQACRVHLHEHFVVLDLRLADLGHVEYIHGTIVFSHGSPHHTFRA